MASDPSLYTGVVGPCQGPLAWFCKQGPNHSREPGVTQEHRLCRLSPSPEMKSPARQGFGVRVGAWERPGAEDKAL